MALNPSRNETGKKRNKEVTRWRQVKTTQQTALGRAEKMVSVKPHTIQNEFALLTKRQSIFSTNVQILLSQTNFRLYQLHDSQRSNTNQSQDIHKRPF